MTFLKLYLSVLLAFIAMDAVWIGLLMKGFYNDELGEIARRHQGDLAPRWPAAVLVYLLIPLGIVLFVRPAMGMNASLFAAARWGATYGFLGYGLYDLTNRATLARWSLKLTVIDMAWGTVICAATAAFMTFIEPRLRRP
jgi:uncharacterized membrane protein